MHVALTTAASTVEVISNAFGIATIVVGLVYVLVKIARNAIDGRNVPGVEPQIALGRWLTLALRAHARPPTSSRRSWQPDWTEIGKLAAIIVLRTMLNYFLAKEIGTPRRRPTRKHEH